MPTSINPAQLRYATYQVEAERVGVTTRTLRTWVEKGLIREYRPYPGSRIVRLNPAEVDALMMGAA